MNRNQTAPSTFRILQQNARKSLMTQLDLLNTLSTDDVDICLIQEPYINFIHLTSATPHWIVIYPTRHNTHPSKTRVVTLVNTKISSDGVQKIPVDSSNVVAVTATTEAGQLDIYNIYLDCTHSQALTPLTETISTWERAALRETPKHLMLVGNFNRHHPLWDEDWNHHLFTTSNLQAAQKIIDIQERLDRTQALPKGIPTLAASNSGNYTRPDNTFISAVLTQMISTCIALPER